MTRKRRVEIDLPEKWNSQTDRSGAAINSSSIGSAATGIPSVGATPGAATGATSSETKNGASFSPQMPGMPQSWTGDESIPISPDVGFYQKYGKRALDLFLVSLGLLLLSPVFLAIIIAIKIEDGGPVFYCSTRVGKGGRRFRFWKFRSMVLDAESVRDSLQNLNEVDGPVFKIENDPRITRIGRILRRTSMDELPQFWNVLNSDMTLIGPRPPIPEEVVKYEPWQLRRLSVRPGLTCLWQVSGRCTIGFDEWMRLDMEYIDRRSLSLDTWILLRTIPAVLSGEGAY